MTINFTPISQHAPDVRTIADWLEGIHIASRGATHAAVVDDYVAIAYPTYTGERLILSILRELADVHDYDVVALLDADCIARNDKDDGTFSIDY